MNCDSLLYKYFGSGISQYLDTWCEDIQIRIKLFISENEYTTLNSVRRFKREQTTTTKKTDLDQHWQRDTNPIRSKCQPQSPKLLIIITSKYHERDIKTFVQLFIVPSIDATLYVLYGFMYVLKCIDHWYRHESLKVNI